MLRSKKPKESLSSSQEYKSDGGVTVMVFTSIIPVVLIFPQPPVKVTV
jgi:hypothetical protein